VFVVLRGASIEAANKTLKNFISVPFFRLVAILSIPRRSIKIFFHLLFKGEEAL
jgi:hypothetical protein